MGQEGDPCTGHLSARSHLPALILHAQLPATTQAAARRANAWPPRQMVAQQLQTGISDRSPASPAIRLPTAPSSAVAEAASLSI